MQTALIELNKPKIQAAVGAMEGAVGDLEAAVKDGLLVTAAGNDLMDRFAGVARQLATDALDEANARPSDPTKIAEAQDALAEGDTLRAAEAFKDAVSKYKDAVAIAEGS